MDQNHSARNLETELSEILGSIGVGISGLLYLFLIELMSLIFFLGL